MEADKKDKKSKHRSRGDSSKDRDRSKREKSHEGERKKSRKHHSKDKDENSIQNFNDPHDDGLKLRKPRNKMPEEFESGENISNSQTRDITHQRSVNTSKNKRKKTKADTLIESHDQ